MGQHGIEEKGRVGRVEPFQVTLPDVAAGDELKGA